MPDAAPADISVWIERLSRRPISRRGSAPDLLQQLQQTLRRPVDRLLCIAADADPSLRLLSGVWAQSLPAVRRGIAIVEQMTGRRATVVEPAAGGRAAYPQLHPSLVIRRRFGRKLRPHKLPTDVGVLLFDAIAAAELAAIERDEPFELPLVIDDPLLGQRHRLSATPSTTVGAALTAAGLSWQGKRLFHGPLLRRFAVDPAVPVGETELWLHVESAMAAVPSAACTRCGDCVAACPVDLHPAALLEAAQAGDREMAQAFAASACIDCGLCSHVCPSRLPIMESIRLLKRPPAEAAR